MKKPGWIVFVLLTLISINKIKASSIMASDISWMCVGQDSFLVKLVVYRDCNGDAVATIPLQITCASTGSIISTVNFYPGTPVDVTPVCCTACTRCQNPDCSFPYGIHRYTMQVIIKLSNAGSCCNIKLSWQLCCRNSSITTGADGKNFYTEATLNRCQFPCDNSPSFSSYPVTMLCVGSEYQYFQEETDVDADYTGRPLDSITYAIVPPLQSATDSIAYSSPYSSAKPIYFYGFPDDKLTFPKGFHFIPELGELDFVPKKAEVTVMTIKVREYRKGKLIGEQRREMEFIVVTCTQNHLPTVKTPNNVRSKSTSGGSPVSFTFSTNDSDINDTLSISWNNNIPGATWSTTNGQSKHPTGTLTWTPTDAQASSLPYTFTVTARDDACPVRGSFTQAYQITVKPNPKARLIVSDSCNGLFYFLAERIQGSGPSYLWQGDNFVFNPKVGPFVWHKFSQYGIYPFTMTMTASGNSQGYFDTIFYFPIKAKLPKDTSLCKNANLHLKLNLDPVPRNYFVEWSSGNYIFRDVTKTDFTITVTGDSTLVANVYTSPSCWVAADTIHIKLLNCTSINDPEVRGHIKMSPNPASDHIVVSTDVPGMKFKTIAIYNNLGILLKQYSKIGANSFIINRDFTKSGMYFVRIWMMNGEVINQKLLWE